MYILSIIFKLLCVQIPAELNYIATTIFKFKIVGFGFLKKPNKLNVLFILHLGTSFLNIKISFQTG